MRTSAKWLFLKLKRFQVGFKYYFANARKMGFYGAFRLQVCCKQFQVPFYRRWQNGISELNEKSNLRFLQIANSDKPIVLYSKVILKVKSLTHIGVWMRLVTAGSAKLCGRL